MSILRIVSLSLMVFLLCIICPSIAVPSISSIDPTSATAGSPWDLTLTVNGDDYVSSLVPLMISTVYWNGGVLATTYVSQHQLTAVIPAANLASPGTATVKVVTSGFITAESNTVTFTIYPTPVILSLSPSSATEGGGEFTLRVIGENFKPTYRIYWNGNERPTTFSSTTELRATIYATDIAAAGTARVYVKTPSSASSNEITFDITSPSGAPTIISIRPSSRRHGTSSFILRISGTQFSSGSVVLWRGAERNTVFVSSSTLRARIPSTDISRRGRAVVKVLNPDLRRSNGVVFTIT